MASCSISGWGVDRTYTLSVTEQSYNAKTNQSVVKWTLSASGSSTWYDYYLYASVNGTKVYSESGSWSKGSFPASTGSTSGTMTINHNSDGKKSISFYIEGYAYQYSTKSSSGSLTLTNLDRTAPTITASDIFDIDVDKFKITATSNVTCSQWAYKIKQGSGSYSGWTYATSSGTSHTFTISGLAMNTTYTVQVAGKKNTNDVWGYSAEKTAKTLGASWIDSAKDITLGETVEIKFTPLDATFKYKIQFLHGGWAGYTTDFIEPASLTQQTYNSYTVPLTVANYITDSDSGVMTAVLFTYDENGNQIGNANNATFTVAVPASIVPTIDNVVLAEGEESGFNLFVKSLSSIEATITASGAYGSTITSVVMTVEGQTYTAVNGVAESNILSTFNETTGLPVVITILDSRNRRATRTLSPMVYDYYLPSFEADAKVYQTTITTTVTGNIAPVNNTNQKRLTIVRRRVVDDVTETYTVNPLSAYAFTQAWLQTLADAGRETYEYTITVADKINSTTAVIQTGVTTLSRHAGGRGVTLFGEAQADGFFIVDTTTGDYLDHQITSAQYLEIATLLADDYNVTSDYFVGEFSIYNSKVWQCNTAIVGGEAWTAGHWDELGDV